MVAWALALLGLLTLLPISLVKSFPQGLDVPRLGNVLKGLHGRVTVAELIEVVEIRHNLPVYGLVLHHCVINRRIEGHMALGIDHLVDEGARIAALLREVRALRSASLGWQNFAARRVGVAVREGLRKIDRFMRTVGDVESRIAVVILKDAYPHSRRGRQSIVRIFDDGFWNNADCQRLASVTLVTST